MKKPPRKFQEKYTVKKCLFCDTPIEHVLRVDHRGKARMAIKCKCQ